MAVDIKTDLSKVRNIGIMAHIDAGKTTTTERILFYTGINYKMGEVHEGAATMDWMEQEQERGITITSAATTCHWKDHQINIIDTPGTSTSRLRWSAHCGCSTERSPSSTASPAWAAEPDCLASGRPVSGAPDLLCEQADRTGASFDFCVSTIKNRLNAIPAVVQLPIGSEANFIGVVDLIKMRALTWRGETTIGEDYTVEEIPADMVDMAPGGAHALIELVADYDDHLMEARLTTRTRSLPACCRLDPSCRPVLPDHRGALRQRLQEQGRAAAA